MGWAGEWNLVTSVKKSGQSKLHSKPLWLGYVRLGLARLGLVRIGLIRLG